LLEGENERNKFMRISRDAQQLLGTVVIMVSLVGTAFAQTNLAPATAPSPFNPIIYPAKGQSQEQLEKDKADSYAWATQQTGYDPVAAALQAHHNQVTQQPVPYIQPAPSQPGGGVVRGGARGAAGGAAIGAIAGDAGKGAAIGAASGGAVGGLRQRQGAQNQAMAQQQAVRQQAATVNQQTTEQRAAEQQKIDAYKRAFEAAMEGKGYTVKW
jgi:hypothetical protein